MAVGFILLRRRVHFPENMETLMFVLPVFASCALLLYQAMLHLVDIETTTQFMPESVATAPALAYLVAPLLATLLARKLTANQTYTTIAFIILGMDALYMLVAGYRSLAEAGASIFPPLLYLFAIVALAWSIFRGIPEERRGQMGMSFRIIALLGYDLSVMDIMLIVGDHIPGVDDLRLAASFVLMLPPLVVLHVMKLDRPHNFYLIKGCIVTALLAIGLEYDYHIRGVISHNTSDPVAAILYIVACLLALTLLFERLRKLAANTAAALRDPQYAYIPYANYEILTAIALHVLLLAIIRTLSGNHDMSYAFSLINMLVALIVVLIGFWTRTKNIRLYGLVVILACVLKLVLLDVGGLDLLMRVIA
ncbi:MAG TPA: hypothetical protein DEB24_00740, partial [Coriobacteriia bacterium]|nr:hypothetical protein [Coriobacteriia bacterium]